MIDTKHVDVWFRDDLQCRGVYKSIALKRYKHTTEATEQWEWEVVDREANKKTFHQAIFDLPLGCVLISVAHCATWLYAIFNSSMPWNSSCSHLINKVNRYLKQSEPSCPCYSLIVWRGADIKDYRNMRKGRKERPPPHKWFSFEYAAYRQQELLLPCLKIILIFAPFDSYFPHSQPNPPTQALLFWKIAFRPFKDASHVPKKIVLGEYYFKIRIDSARRKWSIMWVLSGAGRYGRWKMTLCHELSVSVAQKETSGRTRLQRTQTQLRSRHESGADSLQNKRHQLCWLLTQFARGLIQCQSRETYLWSPCAEATYCSVAGQQKN